MKIEFKSPYNDNSLEWDKETRRYILTKEYALKLLGKNPYQDDTILSARLSQNSRVVYSYILTRGHSANKKLNEVMINATTNGRKLIKEVLTAQFLADTEVGYNDLGKQAPINFTTLRSIDRNTIVENILCTEAQAILENSMGDLYGYNLLSQIPYSKYAFRGVMQEYDSENE